MNKKITRVLVLVLCLFLITGCTKQMKTANGKKIVKSEITNQTLVENVLCKPDKLYDEYDKAIKQKQKDYKKMYKNGDLSKKEYNKKMDSIIDLEKLPKCENISIVQGGYETFWTSVFVKPLAWAIVNLGKIVKNYGLAIILATIIIRLILFPITKKMLNQSENMKKAQPKLDKLEKKYKNKTDQQSMMAKSTEMMAIYKEYNINPVSGCLLSFIQLPLFFAFYEALNRLPILFEDKFLTFNMGMTPLAAIEKGNYIYLILPILVGIVTYYSFKMNKMSVSKEQESQMKMMFNVMIIVIFITSFSMSTAIILYWIINSGFTIIQNILVKRSK